MTISTEKLEQIRILAKKQIEEYNRTGISDHMVGFESSETGQFIVDPFHSETQMETVDPVSYYGCDFLDSDFFKGSSMDNKERFSAFAKELEGLSLKYGIVLQCVGGVAIFEEGELVEIEYSKDSTSGDLVPYYKSK